MKNPFVKYVFIDPLEAVGKKEILETTVQLGDERFDIPLFLLDKILVRGKKGLLISLVRDYKIDTVDLIYLDPNLEMKAEKFDKYDYRNFIQPDQGEFLEHFVKFRYKNQLLLEAKKLEEEAMKLQEKIRKT